MQKTIFVILKTFEHFIELIKFSQSMWADMKDTSKTHKKKIIVLYNVIKTGM